MNTRSMITLTCLFALGAATLSNATRLQAEDATDGEWIQLFNGKDLDGWKVKITGYELGDNFGDTFRVEDGLLKVAYDKYDRFDGKFGHIFYEKPFSHYVLRVEYRFVGDQTPGGPGWAFRNSGLMMHGQSPESMGKNQEFPVSIEVQLLGGRAEGECRVDVRDQQIRCQVAEPCGSDGRGHTRSPTGVPIST